MKLIIERNQRELKGMLGKSKGIVFTLKTTVELSPEEKALVDKYKLYEHALTTRGAEGQEVPGVTVWGLMNSEVQEVKDVTTLLNNERVQKDACKSFKILLHVMSTFGGREEIEIKLPSEEDEDEE